MEKSIVTPSLYINPDLPQIAIEPWRLAIWDDIGFEPNPGQSRLFNTFMQHLYTECEAGRGGGKSFIASHGIGFPEFIRPIETVNHWWEWPRYILIVAPQQDQAEIIFQEIYQLCKDRKVPLKRDRESGDIITKWGSRLRCMTGKNPTAMRGYAWNVVIVDEGSHLEKARYVIDSVIKGTIIRRKGKILIISTPDAPGSFTHECSIRGDDPNIPEWGHVKWISAENWYIPWIAKAIESERRQGVPEDVIQREYMAEFVPHKGLVYPEYVNCIMGEDEVREVESIIFDYLNGDRTCNPNGVWGRAVDFGYMNPHVHITHVRIGETVYAWDEYYARQMTDEEHAPQWIEEDKLYDYSVNVCDLAEPGAIKYYAGYEYKRPVKGLTRLKGQFILKGTKPPIRERIDLLRRLMGTSNYRIHPRCIQYIGELGIERYPEDKEARNAPELPIDANNHGSSGSGYLIHYWFGNRSVSRDIIRIGEERGQGMADYR